MEKITNIAEVVNYLEKLPTRLVNLGELMGVITQDSVVADYDINRTNANTLFIKLPDEGYVAIKSDAKVLGKGKMWDEWLSHIIPEKANQLSLVLYIAIALHLEMKGKPNPYKEMGMYYRDSTKVNKPLIKPIGWWMYTIPLIGVVKATPKYTSLKSVGIEGDFNIQSGVGCGKTLTAEQVIKIIRTSRKAHLGE